MSITHTPEFIEAFAEKCFNEGLSEKVAYVLLSNTQAQEFADDPDFVQGFNQTMEKAAGELDGMFSAQPKPVADFGVGAGLGALGGALLGGAALLRPSIGFKALANGGRKALTFGLNPRNVKMFNGSAVRNTGNKIWSRGTRKLRQAGQIAPDATVQRQWKEFLPKYLLRKTMGPGNAVMAGTTGAGALTGGLLNAHTGTFPGSGNGIPIPGVDAWMPAEGYGSTATSGSSSSSGTASPVWSSGPGFSTDLGKGSGSGGGSAKADPAVEAINRQIGSLESQLAPGSDLGSAVKNNKIREQLRELGKQKSELMAGVAQRTGDLRTDKAHALKSIAENLEDVERAIQARESKGTGVSKWLERSSAPGLEGSLRRGWNSLVGYDQGAEQINSDLQQLYAARENLRRQMQGADNMTR